MSTRPLTERNLEIVRMWDADVPMAQIVRKFLLSHQRISKIVQRYGGKAKRSTWAPARAKIEAHRHEIEAAIAARCPMWRISARFKISMATLHDYGFRGLGHVGAPDRAAEWERLYVDVQLTTGEVARLTKSAQSSVHSYLDRRGLLRSASESQRLVMERVKQARAEALGTQIDAWERMFVTERLSVLEISRRTFHPCSRIKRHLRERGIDTSRNRNRRPHVSTPSRDEVASV